MPTVPEQGEAPRNGAAERGLAPASSPALQDRLLLPLLARGV